jgi:putative addiction module component (TIGR02574 family)
MNTTQLLAEIERLPVADRLVLVQEIWDRIVESNAVLPLTEAQKDELDRRIAELEAHPESAIPWEQVEQSLRSRSRP